MYRKLRLLADETRFSLSDDRRNLYPWGLAGGREAEGSNCTLESADGSSKQLPSKITTTLVRNDVVTLVTPGGGGWGDPSERGQAEVQKDVDDGLISRERAHSVYRFPT